MPEFLKLLPPAVALQSFLQALPDELQTPSERVKTQDALGRALAEAVTAPSPLPPFRRSTVDGYAVRGGGAGQSGLLAGEDVKAGEGVIEAGSLLRAQEIGGLLALGVTEVKVAMQPR